MTSPGGGRFVSWIGFVFGSVMSIAANVLHTWIPKKPDGAPADWAPPVGWSPAIAAQIGSAVWPVALLISVEVLSRVQWPGATQWKVARYGGVGTVGVGSAIISYGHLHEVLLAWGYGDLGSAVGPLVLDGLMVVSGFALLAHGDQPAGNSGGDTAETAPKRREAPAVDRVAAPVRLHKQPAALDQPRSARVVVAVDDPDDEPAPVDETPEERVKRHARIRARRARRKRAEQGEDV